MHNLLHRLDDVPDQLIAGILLSNDAILQRVTEIFSKLEVKNGNIVLSQANLNLLAELFNELDSVLVTTPEYTNTLRKFSLEFVKQADLTDEYLISKFGEFQRSTIAAEILVLSKRRAMDALLGDRARAAFISPLKDILSNAAYSGAPFSDTIKAVKEFTLGDKTKEAKLASYARQVVYDDFAVGNRAYSNVVNDQLGVEWYVYRGGIIKTTRPFCDKRNGEYFHKSEVELLGEGIDVNGKALSENQLKGRAPGTNAETIFVWAGGFQCRHTFMAVSVFDVPREIIIRNIEADRFTPNKTVKGFFGLAA